MPFKILSAASLAAVAYAQLNNSCYMSKGPVGNDNEDFSSDVIDDAKTLDLNNIDTIKAIKADDHLSHYMEVCVSTESTNNLRGFRAGIKWERERAKTDADGNKILDADGNEEMETYTVDEQGSYLGADIDGGKAQDGFGVKCTTHLIEEIDSMKIGYLENDISEAQKGGIFSLGWTDAAGKTFSYGTSTAELEYFTQDFNEDQHFQGFFGRNEKLRPQEVGVIMSTINTQGCKDRINPPPAPTPSPNVDKSDRTFSSTDKSKDKGGDSSANNNDKDYSSNDASKSASYNGCENEYDHACTSSGSAETRTHRHFTSHVPDPSESNSVTAAVVVLVVLFVAFIIFIILIRWDNARVHYIRNRETSDKEKGNVDPEAQRAETDRPLVN